MSEKRTVKISGKDYETVASRVDRFREDNPLPEDSICLTTDIVNIDSESVVMKASIATEGGVVVATGFAEEKRTNTGVNKTSALENCETSAIGRALAAAGFGGCEYASANEVENAIHNQSKPKTEPATKDPAKSTKKYKDALHALQTAILRYTDNDNGKAAACLMELAKKRGFNKVKKTSDLIFLEIEILQDDVEKLLNEQSSERA